MHFGNAFDAVTRIVGIVVRRRNEITNLAAARNLFGMRSTTWPILNL